MSKMQTTQQWIIKAKTYWGNTYDYSKVDYQGAKIRIIVICSIHGGFTTTPSNHLQSRGCPKCFNENKASRTNIIFGRYTK